MLKNIKIGDKIKSYDLKNNKNHFVNVKQIYTNKVEGLKITLDNGNEITTSKDHKFLCSDNKMRPLWQILEKNLSIIVDG